MKAGDTTMDVVRKTRTTDTDPCSPPRIDGIVRTGLHQNNKGVSMKYSIQAKLPSVALYSWQPGCC